MLIQRIKMQNNSLFNSISFPTLLNIFLEELSTVNKKNGKIFPNTINNKLIHISLPSFERLTRKELIHMVNFIKKKVNSSYCKQLFSKGVNFRPTNNQEKKYFDQSKDRFKKNGDKVYKNGDKSYSIIKKTTNNKSEKVKFLILLVSSHACAWLKKKIVEEAKNINISHKLSNYSNIGDGAAHVTICKTKIPNHLTYDDIKFCNKNKIPLNKIFAKYVPDNSKIKNANYSINYGKFQSY